MSYMTRHGPLPDTQNCGLPMRRECQERFPRHRLQKNPLVNDPGMHHVTYVTHVPWCMSGSLISGGGENFPGLPSACPTRNFAYLVSGPWWRLHYTLVSFKGSNIKKQLYMYLETPEMNPHVSTSLNGTLITHTWVTWCGPVVCLSLNKFLSMRGDTIIRRPVAIFNPFNMHRVNGHPPLCV